MNYWTKKPRLRNELWKELAARDVESVRSLLASSTNDFYGASSKTRIPLGSVQATRGEILAWLKWKAHRQALWIVLGAIAAVASGFAAIVGAVLAGLGLLTPVQ